MNYTIKISAVLFTGLWVVGCAMPAGGMKTRQLSLSNPPQKHTVYSNEVSPEFIAGVEGMALGLLTCDAVTKAPKPPLIVIRPLETEGEVSLDTKKYMETERNILTKKAGDKVRFIDKETTEEANYYLYGVISQANTPPSNNTRNDVRKRRPGVQSAPVGALGHSGVQSATNYLAQEAKSNQDADGNKTYKFTMSLVDPRSNATLWKDECGFAPEEIQQHNSSK